MSLDRFSFPHIVRTNRGTDSDPEAVRDFRDLLCMMNPYDVMAHSNDAIIVMSGCNLRELIQARIISAPIEVPGIIYEYHVALDAMIHDGIQLQQYRSFTVGHSSYTARIVGVQPK